MLKAFETIDKQCFKTTQSVIEELFTKKRLGIPLIFCYDQAAF